MIAAGRKASRIATHEPARLRVAWQRYGNAPQPGEIHRQDRHNGAQLDHHLKGLLGRLEAEKMPGKQDMPGGRYGDELRQPFQKAEQQALQIRFPAHPALPSPESRCQWAALAPSDAPGRTSPATPPPSPFPQMA
jgi:hypothetical protein